MSDNIKNDTGIDSDIDFDVEQLLSGDMQEMKDFFNALEPVITGFTKAAKNPVDEITRNVIALIILGYQFKSGLFGAPKEIRSLILEAIDFKIAQVNGAPAGAIATPGCPCPRCMQLREEQAKRVATNMIEHLVKEAGAKAFVVHADSADSLKKTVNQMMDVANRASDGKAVAIDPNPDKADLN